MGTAVELRVRETFDKLSELGIIKEGFGGTGGNRGGNLSRHEPILTAQDWLAVWLSLSSKTQKAAIF